MSGLELFGALLGLYPIAVGLATGHRSKPRLHSELAVSSVMFGNTVRGLLASATSHQEMQHLAPSYSQIDLTLWEDPALQRKLRDHIGGRNIDVVLKYLAEMQKLLDQIHTELNAMAPGSDTASLQPDATRPCDHLQYKR